MLVREERAANSEHKMKTRDKMREWKTVSEVSVPLAARSFLDLVSKEALTIPLSEKRRISVITSSSLAKTPVSFLAAGRVTEEEAVEAEEEKVEVVEVGAATLTGALTCAWTAVEEAAGAGALLLSMCIRRLYVAAFSNSMPQMESFELSMSVSMWPLFSWRRTLPNGELGTSDCKNVFKSRTRQLAVSSLEMALAESTPSEGILTRT